MTERVRVLVVEDNPADVDLLREVLPETGLAGHTIQSVARLSEALACLKAATFDVVLLDLGLPDSQGLATFRVLSSAAPHLPVIVLTGNSDRDTALTAVKEGAQDYLLKGRIDGEALTRALRFAIERKRSEDALKKSEERFRRLMNEAADAIFVHDESGRLMDVNRAACQNLGYSREELLSKNIGDIDPEANRAWKIKLWDRVFAGESFTFESSQIRKDGSPLPVEVRLGAVILPSGPAIMGVVRDITDRKQAQIRERLTRDILSSLNHRESATDAIRDILHLIKESTEIEAAGIRLRVGDDFPYFQTNGFPDHFVEFERSLCTRDEAGRLMRDSEGNVILECMCGNVIRGRTDPKQPFFTAGGSFWSNGTTDLLASTKEEDRQARTRNRCNGEGYESVALIPLRSGDEIIGLLQLNDHRRDQFTPEMIQFFEGLGASIGIALSRKRAEEMLSRSEHRFRQLADLLPQIIFETDARGTILFTNQVGLKSFGYAPEEVQAGINLLSLIAPEYREVILQRFQENLRGTAVTGIREARAVRKNGTQFPIMLHADAILESGIAVGVRGIAIDITERKQAELELLEAKALVETVVEQIPLMIFLKEAKDLKFVIFNHAGEELLGHDRKALLGKNNLDLFPPEQAAHFMAKDREALAGHGLVDIPEEFIQTAKKGTRILHTRKVCILGEDGTTKYLLGISEDITESKKTETRLQKTLLGLQTALRGIIQVLAAVSEIRDPYTAGHQKRVANLAQAIGQELEFTPERVEGIRVAGLIHDIGKMSIPAEILSKPAVLSKNEYALIQSHAQIGHDILSEIEFDWPIAQIILQHHERMDGSGYPQRLKGDDILFESRILAVADVIEAMASHRPYRPALGVDAAIQEIEKNKDVLYDSAVVEACLRLFRDKGYTLNDAPAWNT